MAISYSIYKLTLITTPLHTPSFGSRMPLLAFVESYCCTTFTAVIIIELPEALEFVL